MVLFWLGIVVYCVGVWIFLFLVCVVIVVCWVFCWLVVCGVGWWLFVDCWMILVLFLLLCVLDGWCVCVCLGCWLYGLLFSGWCWLVVCVFWWCLGRLLGLVVYCCFLGVGRFCIVLVFCFVGLVLVGSVVGICCWLGFYGYVLFSVGCVFFWFGWLWWGWRCVWCCLVLMLCVCIWLFVWVFGWCW